jgi:hypothetical protein
MNKKQESTHVKETTGYWNAPFQKREKDSDDIDLSCLIGKKIVAVGRLDQSKFPKYTANEADMAVDYLDGEIIKRLVFGATDCGWWVQWEGLVGTPSRSDSLRSRLNVVWNDNQVYDKLKIVDKPTERRYSFVGPKGKEVFSLSIGDLKCMPEDVRKRFTSSKPKNVANIVCAIGEWVLEL